ncbi:MAG TPA: cupin domain-containing protein [Ilumatobacter sp.]|nr:cupin domain-containing protein [Ilumatobacter sp.]
MNATSATEPATPEAKVFRYVRPELNGRSKKVTILGRTDISVAAVQRVSEGGENNLHSHATLDGYWFVLEGRVKFYTTHDELVADLGKYEGILIPRGYPYWFESSGDEDLELLQVEASAAGPGSDMTKDRVDHAPVKQATLDVLTDHGRIPSTNA